MKYRFRLIKPFGQYKKGKIYDSFGGLVRGLFDYETSKTINFDNQEYFKLVKNGKKRTKEIAADNA